MSPKETSSGGRPRSTGPFTPARIAMAVVAVLTLVLIFENTRQVRVRLIIPEVTMPLYLALLATTLLGGACGYYAATRRRA
ncbi:DUF1049 domain-containing protein [Streptomyces sp. NPDC014870]|uniref:DUF1049 domain-containing protein n=1 Tax=Streptomyces sp. NPDC014870 TaxID=3364925 RepID=UPI0036F7F0CD